MLDLTIREIDAFARGVDASRRADMATALWAAWSTAGFSAYAWAGKRLPNIEPRLQAIMNPAATRRGDAAIANAVLRMKEIAKRRGLPPPKPRRVPSPPQP